MSTYISLSFIKLQNNFKRSSRLGTNKLDTCRIDVKKKESVKMAKENDDIRDIIDKQEKEQNLNQSSNKNKWLAFYLLALFAVIYLFLS